MFFIFSFSDQQCDPKSAENAITACNRHLQVTTCAVGVCGEAQFVYDGVSKLREVKKKRQISAVRPLPIKDHLGLRTSIFRILFSLDLSNNIPYL